MKWMLLMAIMAFAERPAFGFTITDSLAEPHDPKMGGVVRLKCRSSGWFEYCTWKHRDWVCEFEWKRSHDAVKKQTCTALGDRARFVGTYESHECEIEIHGLSKADAGNWTCEMEEYQYGLTRGHTDIATISISIDEPSTTTVSATTTATAKPSVDDGPTERSLFGGVLACSSNPCMVNTVCLDSSDGGFECACQDGFAGDPYNSPGCIDIIFPDTNLPTTTENTIIDTTSSIAADETTGQDQSNDTNQTTEQPMMTDANGNLVQDDTSAENSNATSTAEDLAAETEAIRDIMIEETPAIPQNTLIGILVGAAVLAVALAALIAFLVYRHRQRYNVSAAWKARDNDSDASGQTEEAEDHVIFTAGKDSKVELGDLKNDKGFL